MLVGWLVGVCFSVLCVAVLLPDLMEWSGVSFLVFLIPCVTLTHPISLFQNINIIPNNQYSINITAQVFGVTLTHPISLTKHPTINSLYSINQYHCTGVCLVLL